MRPVVLGVAAVFALSAPASAALTVLCVADKTTGFDWRNGEWVQQNYTTETYLIQDVSDDEQLRGDCRAQTITFATGGSADGRCFNISTMGDPKLPIFTSLCRTFTDGGIMVSRVYCPDALLEKFSLAVTGEFVSSRTYAAPEVNPKPDADRDSLAITVGKCSVVSQ